MAHDQARRIKVLHGQNEMIDTLHDISKMLIENLASAASRMGGLDETEARRWASAQSSRILAAKVFDFDSLEQLLLDKSAAEMYWCHERLPH